MDDKKSCPTDSAKRRDTTATSPETPRPKILPVAAKIGEGEGNLRRREGWFQRRTGGSR